MDNYKVLEVTHIESGERIKIKGYRFNPALHEDAKVVGEMKMVGKVSTYKAADDAVDLGELDTPESPALEVPVEEAQEPVEEPESDEEEEVEGVPENYCEACDKTFKRPQDLKTHNKRFHGEEVDEEEGS